MYGWLWRSLPGPTAVRVLECLVLLTSIVIILMLAVFPAVEPHLPFSHVTVDEPAQ